MLLRYSCKVLCVHDEQQRAHYWALRHRADDVDDGRRAAAKHDTECSARQTRPEPLQHHAMQPELLLKPAYQQLMVDGIEGSSSRQESWHLSTVCRKQQIVDHLGHRGLCAVELSICGLHLLNQSVAVKEGLNMDWTSFSNSLERNGKFDTGLQFTNSSTHWRRGHISSGVVERQLP